MVKKKIKIKSYSYRRGKKIIKVPSHKRTYNLKNRGATKVRVIERITPEDFEKRLIDIEKEFVEKVRTEIPKGKSKQRLIEEQQAKIRTLREKFLIPFEGQIDLDTLKIISSKGHGRLKTPERISGRPVPRLKSEEERTFKLSIPEGEFEVAEDITVPVAIRGEATRIPTFERSKRLKFKKPVEDGRFPEEFIEELDVKVLRPQTEKLTPTGEPLKKLDINIERELRRKPFKVVNIEEDGFISLQDFKALSEGKAVARAAAGSGPMKNFGAIEIISDKEAERILKKAKKEKEDREFAKSMTATQELKKALRPRTGKGEVRSPKAKARERQDPLGVKGFTLRKGGTEKLIKGIIEGDILVPGEGKVRRDEKKKIKGIFIPSEPKEPEPRTLSGQQRKALESPELKGMLTPEIEKILFEQSPSLVPAVGAKEKFERERRARQLVEGVEKYPDMETKKKKKKKGTSAFEDISGTKTQETNRSSVPDNESIEELRARQLTEILKETKTKRKRKKKMLPDRINRRKFIVDVLEDDEL